MVNSFSWSSVTDVIQSEEGLSSNWFCWSGGVKNTISRRSESVVMIMLASADIASRLGGVVSLWHQGTVCFVESRKQS